MRNVHRPHDSALSYGMHLIEIHDGHETVVPDELICRARPTTIRDANLLWVSVSQAHQLEKAMTDAHQGIWEQWMSGTRPVPMDATEALNVAQAEGYSQIGVIYCAPDDNVLEHHVLARNEAGEHADIVLVHWDEGNGYYLHHVDVQRTDLDQPVRILRLSDPPEINLAEDHGLLCGDEEGFHVQVQALGSFLWYCQADEDPDQKLRRVWANQIRQTGKTNP